MRHLLACDVQELGHLLFHAVVGDVDSTGVQVGAQLVPDVVRPSVAMSVSTTSRA
nr:hypothetical protein [Azospirillum sp. INR13]